MNNTFIFSVWLKTSKKLLQITNFRYTSVYLSINFVLYGWNKYSQKSSLILKPKQLQFQLQPLRQYNPVHLQRRERKNRTPKSRQFRESGIIRFAPYIRVSLTGNSSLPKHKQHLAVIYRRRFPDIFARPSAHRWSLYSFSSPSSCKFLTLSLSLSLSLSRVRPPVEFHLLMRRIERARERARTKVEGATATGSKFAQFISLCARSARERERERERAQNGEKGVDGVGGTGSARIWVSGADNLPREIEWSIPLTVAPALFGRGRRRRRRWRRRGKTIYHYRHYRSEKRGEGEEKGASTREICFFSGPLPAWSNYALAKRARAQKPTVPVMSLLELFFFARRGMGSGVIRKKCS